MITLMGGGENLLTNLSRHIVIEVDGIRTVCDNLPHIIVGVSTYFLLIHHYIVQFLVFCLLILDDNPLLEQTISIVNMIVIFLSFYCPLLPPGEMEFCILLNSQ